MIIDFEHRMSSHCENGVTGNLLKFYGIDLSEAMIFGLGSGLFFTYLPFLKVNGAPGTSFRPMPGMIFKRINKSLGVKTKSMRFPRNPDKAMKMLDKKLSEGVPVGMVVGVYHLTYFPEVYRFHFNAHNIVAYGKENGKYIVSDPIMETPEWITEEDLRIVRYAKGTIKPKGKMYYITHVPDHIDIEKAIPKAIKTTSRQMVVWPGPIVGVSAIRMLAKHVRKWGTRLPPRKAAKYLGSVVRMQEEIGTGGAGFRFLYAAFLQESGTLLNHQGLLDAAMDMTETGDRWRDFAVAAARVCKSRPVDGESYDSVAEMLMKLADREERLFKRLYKMKF